MKKHTVSKKINVKDVCYVRFNTLLELKSPEGKRINAYTFLSRALDCFDPLSGKHGIYSIENNSTIVEFDSNESAKLFTEFFSNMLFGIKSLSITKLNKKEAEKNDDEACNNTVNI